MNKKVPHILIIIVTWNKKQYVVDLLKSLQDIKYPQKNFDIVVVDNASNDGTQDSIRNNYPNIHLICNSDNLGGTGGFNTGLAYAFKQEAKKYQYLWLLDNDVQVNINALSQLVEVLENNKEIAIVGSTMMQMDYPHRINEMGALVDKNTCTLDLKRFLEIVPSFQKKTLNQLLKSDLDLTSELKDCKTINEVDYVAAASLLIKADIAKEAGIWDDYFIHYDDVEWCLRIANMGYKIAVSTKSLIWHMSADTKVPDWILYYDNRNALMLLKKHSTAHAVKKSKQFTLKKALYYTLLGKVDLAMLHFDAVDDFNKGITGKKDISLKNIHKDVKKVESFSNVIRAKQILIPWTVDTSKYKMLCLALNNLIKEGYNINIDYIENPKGSEKGFDTSCFHKINKKTVPHFFLLRYIKYAFLYNKYDLVIQSDYQPILPLSFIAPKILYLNYSTLSSRERISVKEIAQTIIAVLRRWWS